MLSMSMRVYRIEGSRKKIVSTLLTFLQYAANLPSGRMSPPTERDLSLPSSLLPALAPQPWGGTSSGAPGRSAAAHPTPRLPASPYRVDSSRLAGATPSSTPPASVAHNVAPTWAATRAGLSDNSPSIFDFMSLYEICVATGHTASIFKVTSRDIKMSPSFAAS
jgi:hypothetical protein